MRVVAIDRDCWILEALDEFGPHVKLSPAELAEQYGGDGKPVPVIDENEMQQSMPRNWLDQIRREHAAGEKTDPPAPSPEDIFKVGNA